MSVRHARVLLGSALALALACGGGGVEPTPQAAEAAVPKGPPTFNRDVAPIVFRHCAPCHYDGGPGPFALLTYDDVHDHASQIVELTGKRIMPPWLPAPELARYAGERRLAQAEIDTLAAWVEAGRLEGEAADRPSDLPPAPPAVGTWRGGPPDVVLEMAEAFELPADGRDIYRNFVIRVPAAAEGWVKSVELAPGNPKVVHHMVMRVDKTGTAARRDAEDPAPGFDGMDFAGALMPDGRFVGWTPGKAIDPGSAARAFRLQEGTDLVLQVHLRPSGKPERVQVKVGLHMSERPATRHALAMELASTDIDLPAGAKDVHVTDRYTLPVDTYVVSVYPHAHYLGKQLQGWAELPDGSKKWLVRIDDWNFDWQDQYRFAEPMALPAGTVLRMDFSFDNSADNPHNPNQPPQRVTFGQQSTDEMAELILEIEPADPATLVELDRNFMNGWLDRQIAHFRRVLAKTPDDGTSLIAMASLEARRGRPEAAIEHYQAGIAALPARADARIDLAIVLMSQAKLDEARAQLEASIAAAPDDARAHLTLGNLLRKQRSYDAAIVELRRAVELDPAGSESWNNLGITYELARNLGEAETALARAVELAPKRALFRENLARIHAAQGRDADALAGFRAVLEQDDRSIPALQGLAMVLVRTSEPGSSGAYKAVEAAQRAVQLTQGREPAPLEVLAAAFAASGQRDKALEAAVQALALAKERGDATLIDRLQTRLAELTG